MTTTNGSAYFLNRGILISSVNFPTAYKITGSFEFTGNPNDQFQINLRTDGTLQNPAKNFALGTYIHFGGGDEGLNGNNFNIGIEDDIAGTVAFSYFAFNTNTFYNFSIIDTGTNIALYFTNSVAPFLQLSTTNRQGGGNKIDIENSRGTCGGDPIGSGSAIILNSLTVQQVFYLNVLGIGNAAINLNFQTQTNTIYYIQASSDFSLWTNYDGPFLGNGNPFIKAYSTTKQSYLFYRLSAASLESW